MVTTLDSYYEGLYSTIQSIATHTGNNEVLQKQEDIQRLRKCFELIIAEQMITASPNIPEYIQVSDDLPDLSSSTSSIIVVDVMSMNKDLDITSWNPNVDEGTVIRIRKANSTIYKIKWLDSNTNIQYNFVDKPGEFISVQRHDNNFIIS